MRIRGSNRINLNVPHIGDTMHTAVNRKPAKKISWWRREQIQFISVLPMCICNWTKWFQNCGCFFSLIASSDPLGGKSNFHTRPTKKPLAPTTTMVNGWRGQSKDRKKVRMQMIPWAKVSCHSSFVRPCFFCVLSIFLMPWPSMMRTTTTATTMMLLTCTSFHLFVTVTWPASIWVFILFSRWSSTAHMHWCGLCD